MSYITPRSPLAAVCGLIVDTLTHALTDSSKLNELEVIKMDIEARLRKLESRYRTALSAAVAAKAHYLALTGEPSVTPAAVERAKSFWHQLESRKRTIAAQMVALEALEDAAE